MPNTPSIIQTTSDITFTNNFLTYRILRATGLGDRFIINASGENLVAKAHPFVLYITSDTTPGGARLDWIDLDKIEYAEKNGNEGEVKILFKNKVSITIACKAEPSHFLFDLVEVDTSSAAPEIDIATILLAYIEIKGDAYGETIGAVHNQGYAVSELALNKETHIFSNRPGTVEERYNLWAQSFAVIDLSSAKTALLACPKGEWLTHAEAIALQYGLPRRTIDGVWDKKHADVKRSYFFVDIDEKNVSDMIRLARYGGFKHIMPYVSTWAKTTGSYQINPDHYPRGLDGLNEVVSMVHARGLKFGFHNLSFMISGNDPLVSPTPDARLAKESPGRLAATIDAKQKEIPAAAIAPETIEAVKTAYNGYFAAGERGIIIENEIMTCSSFVDRLSDGNPLPGFIVVQRGAFGTVPATHAADSTIYHLPEFFDTFLADLNSDLPDQIANAFADIYNEVEGDFLFLDGADGMHRTLPKPPRDYWWENGSWYASALTAEKFTRYLQRDVLLQSSSASSRNVSFAWHLYARGSSGDYVTIGVEKHLDHSRIGRMRDIRLANSFMPQELGWIVLHSKVGTRRIYNNVFASTTLDEIEFIMNRALGFGLPISLETREAELRASGLTDEVFKLIGLYEKLRLTNYFPDSMLQKLQRPDDAFIERYQLAKEQHRLMRGRFGRYGFRRQVYYERVVSNNETFGLENPFSSQRLKVKITALPGRAAFDEDGNIELLKDRDGSIRFDAQNKAGPVTCTHANGQITAKYPPQNPGAREFSWCSFTRNLVNPLDLSRYKAIGVELVGDGKGEVVVIQLTDNRGFHRQYLVPIDLDDNGNARQVLLDLPAAGEQFDYPDFYEGVLALRYFDYSKVCKLTIHLRAIPQSDEGVTVTLKSIRALRQEYPLLARPSFTLNNRTITFPTVLNPRDETLNAEPWDYLSFNGYKYIKYDGNHNRYQSDGGASGGQIPIVKKGPNDLAYHHEGGNLALVQILVEGPVEYS